MKKIEFIDELSEEAFKIYSNSDYVFYLENDTYYCADNQKEKPYIIGTLQDVEDFLIPRYTINVKGHHGGFDFTKYTFDEVKKYFIFDLDQVEPEDMKHFKKLNDEINEAIDIDDLKDILIDQCEGMEFQYEIEEY